MQLVGFMLDDEESLSDRHKWGLLSSNLVLKCGVQVYKQFLLKMESFRKLRLDLEATFGMNGQVPQKSS